MYNSNIFNLNNLNLKMLNKLSYIEWLMEAIIFQKLNKHLANTVLKIFININQLTFHQSFFFLIR